MKSINKVCVYGIGGVGGYFGGMMAAGIRRDSSLTKEIYFIARGEHLKVIKRNSLVLSIPGQNEFTCTPTWAGEKFGDMPKADLILLCVKSYDLEQVLNEMAQSISEDAIIIPLLNGVDIYERIRKVIKKGVVLPACVYVASHIETAGKVVLDDARGGYIVLGRDPENIDIMPQNVLDLFDSAGIHYKWFDNPFPAIWEKYLFVASFALVTALYGKTFKEVVDDSDTKKYVVEVMNEIIAVGMAEGIEFREDIINELLVRAESLDSNAKSSFQRDIEKKKLKNESDIFGSAMIRLGKKHGVKTIAIEKALSGILSQF